MKKKKAREDREEKMRRKNSLVLKERNEENRAHQRGGSEARERRGEFMKQWSVIGGFRSRSIFLSSEDTKQWPPEVYVGHRKPIRSSPRQHS